MSDSDQTTITLKALEGEPLKNEPIRNMVEATAHAIAERQGVGVIDVSSEPDQIRVTLKTGRIQALGFAAELRRLTTNWYTNKFGVDTLWGEPPETNEDCEGDEEWGTT